MGKRKEMILGIIIGCAVGLLLVGGIGFYVYETLTALDNYGSKTTTSNSVSEKISEQSNTDQVEEESEIIDTSKEEARKEENEEENINTKDYFPLHQNLSYIMIEEGDLYPREFVKKYEGKQKINGRDVYVVSTETILNDEVMAEYQYFYSINEAGDIYKIGEKRDNGVEWKSEDKQEVELFGTMKEGQVIVLEENEFLKHSKECVGFKDITLPTGDIYEDTLQINTIMEFKTNKITNKNYYHKGVGLVYFEYEYQSNDGSNSKSISYVPKDSIQYDKPSDEKDEFMSEDEVLDIVFFLDEVQSIEAPEIGAEIVTYPTQENPVYEVKIFEDLEDHIATYNYYTVDARTGEILSAAFDTQIND